jgi:uncharacterized membrane protein YphA (DoxX/SURF4 family)
MAIATNESGPQGMTSHLADQPHAGIGLALVRLTIGAMFVWVFFENLGKDLYTPSGYAGLIHDYIENGQAPAAWKSVMALAASHASVAAPLQGVTEISLGVLLVLGLFARPVALVAFGFLTSLWVSEWGTAWIWELLVPVLASLALAVGGAGRTWGVDSFLARKRPTSLWW